MTATGAARPALYERDTELAALAEAVRGTRARVGSLVLVEGAPGIGKTRLLGESGALADAHGQLVLTARGAERELEHPYGVVRQLLERSVLTADAARRGSLLGGAARHAEQALGVGGSGTADSFAVLHGLYWLVANLAAERPLLLSVDDLQWADPASVRLLAYLARRVVELPVALVVALRPAELPSDAAVRDLLAQPEAILLRPAPLTEEGTARVLAASLLDAPTPELTAACQRATGGNPFLLRQLCISLLTESIGRTADVAARVAQLRPEGVRRSIMLRLGSMAVAAVELASAVAVLGDGVRLSQAAELAALDGRDAELALDALVRSQVLLAEPALGFVHPLVRGAVYDELGPARRKALHAAAARSLRASGASPEHIARHLLHVEPAGEEDACVVLLEAGRAAVARGAADAALPFLARALAEPPPQALHGAVLVELGRAEFLVRPGDPSAVAHLRSGIEMDERLRGRTELWRMLSLATLLAHSVAGSVEVLEDAMSSSPSAHGEDFERVRMEAITQAATHPATAAIADRLVAEIEEPEGTGAAERLRLCCLAQAEVRDVGAADRTAELCRRALGDGQLLARETADSNVVYQLMYHLTFADEPEHARSIGTAAIAEARSRGSTWGMTAALATRSWTAYRAGDMPAAEADARQAIASPVLPPLALTMTCTVLALPLVERGQLDEAERTIARVGCESDLTLPIHGAILLMARGMLRRAQGRPAEALEDFLEYGRRAAAVRWDSPAIAWRAEAAEQLLLLGERAHATRLADEQLDLARRWGAASAVAAGLRAAGLAARGDRGLDLLRGAARLLVDSPARLERARALVTLGAALRRGGLRVEARERLREGIEIARRCGATGLARAGHDELVAAGARPRRLQFSGVEALTAGERRVCALAAGGRSNRDIAQELFVTVRTVENHLGRAYTKLGISSRGDLASTLAAPGEGPQAI